MLIRAVPSVSGYCRRLKEVPQKPTWAVLSLQVPRTKPFLPYSFRCSHRGHISFTYDERYKLCPRVSFSSSGMSTIPRLAQLTSHTLGSGAPTTSRRSPIMSVDNELKGRLALITGASGGNV